MVSTTGHLWGFFYTFLLLLQGSLFFTRTHLNRFWMVTQEILVAVHGTLVAVMQGNGIWPMFFFGFAGLFIITQMHGLRLSLRTRWLLLAGYIAGVVVVYSGRGWGALNEIIRIPVIEYLAVVVLALLIGGGLWIYRQVSRLRQGKPKNSAIEAPSAGD
jgi:hypothetical protein